MAGYISRSPFAPLGPCHGKGQACPLRCRVCLSFAWIDHTPRVIGHRGAPREAPENTLASFRVARAEGVRAVELDARLSADGVPVVHHDATLGRVIAGEGAVEEIGVEALAAAGVPRLADVLALPLLVDVELKSDAGNAVELPARVLDVVRRAEALDRALVTSFDLELADAYAARAQRPAGMILPFPPEEDLLASFPRLAFVALAEDAAIPEALAACAVAGGRALVWTVDDESRARRLLLEGAAGVITDRPGALARRLEDAPAG